MTREELAEGIQQGAEFVMIIGFDSARELLALIDAKDARIKQLELERAMLLNLIGISEEHFKATTDAAKDSQK